MLDLILKLAKGIFGSLVESEDASEIAELRAELAEKEIQLIAADTRRIEKAHLFVVGNGDDYYKFGSDGFTKVKDVADVDVYRRAINPEWQEKYKELEKIAIETAREKADLEAKLEICEIQLSHEKDVVKDFRASNPLPVRATADDIVSYENMEKKERALDLALVGNEVVFAKIACNGHPFWVRLIARDFRAEGKSSQYLGLSWNASDDVPFSTSDIIRFNPLGVIEICNFEDFFTYKNNLEPKKANQQSDENK